MASQCRHGTVALVLFAGVLAASCSDDPSTPTQPSPPAGSAVITVVRLLLETPASIAPEQSVQLHARALRGDGTTEDVTSRTQWSSADRTVVDVDPGGRATGHKVGEVAVSATYQSATNTHYATGAVVVLGPGTYKLSGRITDSGVPIVNATVSVSDGSNTDVRTSSGPGGAFAVYGVTGRLQLRASREGYASVMQDFEVTQDTVRNIEMVPDRLRLDLSGNYTLVIALGPCDDRAQGVIAAEFASRRYTAVVSQIGPKLALSLGNADFITRDGRGDHFDGAVEPNGNVMFELGNPDDYYLTEYPALVERVSPTAAFLAHGTVKAQATSTSVRGMLTGPIIIAAASDPSFLTRSAWCYSDRHAFEMRRD
jgi:hypothetical protein